MPLLLKAPYGNTATDAFAFARDRGILPTWMGTEELRELEAAIKERAVFSAHTTNAVYLEELRKKILRFIENGYNGDQALLRLELKQLLVELAYDPLTGFPGDEELGIPPAVPGSLQDLSSDRRINLILDTQMSLMAGKGQQQRGLEPAALEMFPAYELVRIREVRVPRDWHDRWEQAGGTILMDDDGRLRLVALKTSEIWSLLGDPAIFPDALGVSYPPFCFSSGMGWEAVEADEWDRLWLIANPGGEQEGAEAEAQAPKPAGKSARAPLNEAGKSAHSTLKLPPAVVGTHGMSRETLLEIRDLMRNTEAANGRLTLKSIFAEAPPPPPPARPRLNADLLLHLADLQAEINAHKRKPRNKGEGDGVPCGEGYISKNKKCHKGVALLSSDETLTPDEAAQALDQARHHHLFHAVRHWFDKSYKRLNQQPGSKETQQLKAFIARIEPTPLDVPVYRGMRFKSRDELASFVAKVKRGEWPDMPVNAFSKKPGVAMRFAAPRSTDDGQFNAVVRLTRSKSGRNIQPLADVVHPAVAHQDEVIFLPGAKFTLQTDVIKTEGGLTALISGHED